MLTWSRTLVSWAPWCLGWLLLALCAAPAAQAKSFWPFGPDAEHQLQEARLARQRLDFGAASRALDEVLRYDPHLEAAVLHERGLIARDRGDNEHALLLLARAADLDGALPARVDQAGVLVQVGRWPEAVMVLRQAVEERGPSLPVEQLTGDRRFVRLGTLKPYQELMQQAKLEQVGPLGRVLVRLERLQGSVNAAEHGWQRLGAWFALVKGLAASSLTAVLLLLGVALGLTFGVAQLGVVRPPYTVLVGVLGANAIWAAVARQLSEGEHWGGDTILRGSGTLLVVYAGARLSRMLYLRYRMARVGSADPFLAEHLPDTLMLVDEVSRLGHRLTGGRRRDQRVLSEALRQAADTLRERLDKGALL